MYVEKFGNIYELTCILLETLLLHILELFFICLLNEFLCFSMIFVLDVIEIYLTGLKCRRILGRF